MRAIVTLVMTFGLLTCGVGCSPTSLAKRGLKEVKGASSKSEVVPGTTGGGLSRFGGVKIARPQTDLGGLVDSRFRSALTSELQGALTRGKKPVFPGGTPVLAIEPEITWYHKAGALGGIMGSDSFAVGLFWLKADGADIGRVQVVTKSGAMRTGPEDMAKSMAGELAKFLKKKRKN